jgi:AraC-like DNA-binding protein
MQHKIKRYQVQHPLLKKYINFFWELQIDHIQLHHRLVPQRNINLRFNLSDIQHYISHQGKECLLEDVYFTGLQSKFLNAYLKLNGKVDVLGICFAPDGFYPFLKIPVSEFRNQILGAGETGFLVAKTLIDKLKSVPDTGTRLAILENDLLSILRSSCETPDNFRQIFKALRQHNSPDITDFCRQNNISIRQLERMYIKYVGLPASMWHTLNRFHSSMNQLLHSDYSKLSDLAYDNEFFDQVHFIKEFRRFAGDTPGKFLRTGKSILQIGKIE